MVDRSDIRRATEILFSLGDQARTCKEVADALVETGQPIQSNIPFHTTDYERARARMIESCEQARRTIAGLRLRVLSGALIRAEASLARVEAACHACRSENVGRLRQGKPFECLVSLKLSSGPRLVLDEEGNIHERT